MCTIPSIPGSSSTNAPKSVVLVTLPCTVELGVDGATVRFDDPQRAVAPGQTVALYDEREPDAVLGAGIVR